MVTRASTRKESTTKPPRKPDAPAEKSAAPAPKPPTDLISPKKKKPVTEHQHRPVRRSGVPPISKARPQEPRQEPAPAPAPSKESVQAAQAKSAQNAPKPETVSLIEERRPKKIESAAPTETRSVLPPISKIRPPSISRPVEPEPKAAPVDTAPPVETDIAPAVSDDKTVHIKPPIIVRELAQRIGIKPFQLISDLMEMNIFAAINHSIEPDVAAAICKGGGDKRIK